MQRGVKLITALYLLGILISGCATLQGRNPEVNLSKGIEIYNRGEYENAVGYFNECITNDKKNSTSHLWLGNALLARGKEGDLKAALIEFKKAVDLSKDSEKVLAQIRSFFFARADNYSKSGDAYMESRCYLAYTENFNKKDVDAYVKLGRIMLGMGNQVAAVYYAKKAYALEPKNASVRELLSTLNSPL
jgi:tetratricopeptide (TPR) repeat protein